MPRPVVSYRRVGAVAVICIDNPPVNALGQAVRAGLIAALDRAECDPQVLGVLLVGAGRGFSAGADIKEFGSRPRAPSLPQVCARFETAQVPVVAALHGVALGGGLELALAAHYRVALEGTWLGLPEVTLGVIPGAGGTQRLPRLAGLASAVACITTGRRFDAAEAVDMGIVDRLGGDSAEPAGLAYIRGLLEQGALPRPTCDLPVEGGFDWEAAGARVARHARGQTAPLAALRAVRAATSQPFDEAMRTERQIFEQLLGSEQRRALVHAFFAERAAAQLPELRDSTARPLRRIGVVGGGTMGSGIVASALLSGFDVTLVETTADTLQAATARVAAVLRGAVARGKLDQAGADTLLADRLVGATGYAALADADLVIEAVVEDLSVKQSVFRQLDVVCRPDCVLASNTSYLSIDDIAAETRRVGAVLGLHFFAPAHVMKLLEVVVPERTAPDVVATGFALAKRMAKTAVRSGVCDGFVGNRILHRCRTVADQMVLLGVDPWDIDAALVDFGYPMGPYAVADLAGLDIGWANRKRRAQLYGKTASDAQFPDQLCAAGHFGRKTGKGYYDYSARSGGDDGSQALRPNGHAAALIAAERAARLPAHSPFDAAQVVRSYLAAMVNEAAKTVQEGIARRPSDVDVVLIAGYGFPRHWGGPMHWADTSGLDVVLHDIRRFADDIPCFGAPAGLLERLVADNKSFDDLNR